MKLSIGIKLIIGYIVIGIAGFILISSFSHKNVLEKTCRNTASNLYQEASFISTTYGEKYFNGSMDENTLTSVLKPLSSYLQGEIWMVSPDKKVTLSTNAEHNNLTISEFQLKDFNQSCYLTGDFYKAFPSKYLTVCAQVADDYSLNGYVLIHIPMSLIEQQVLKLLNTTYITFLVIMLILLAGLIILECGFVKNTKQIKNHLQNYHKGNISAPLSITSNDELGEIASYVSYIEQQLGSLEDDQQKFISNISHDFRSPLTSLKGYIEAMLDGTIPPELYEKYLKIVLSEAKRLSKLSEGLLELNKVGSPGALLDVSTFDIHQVIRSALMTFEGQCSQRRIELRLLFPTDTLYVKADLSKIQQVLYNLVDNAIKFSYDNSKIQVETSIKGGKVLVSVKDFGQGIPKESLPKIWNRFYKTDASRGRDKQGSGIGLSIVKGIIQAHGENINVVSTLGGGSEFIFTLPRA